MEIKIKKIYILIALGALLGLSYYLGGIKGRHEAESLSEAVTEAHNQLISQARSYQMIIDGKNVTVTTQNTVIMDQKTAIENGILEQERLRALNIKSVRENVVLRGQVAAARDSIKSIKPDTIVVHDSSGVDYNYLLLPFYRHYQDNYLDIGFNVNEDASWGYSVKFGLDVNVTMGRQKVGFMKLENKAIVTTDSPYVNFINVQSVQIENRPFFERPVVKWGLPIATFGVGYWLGGR